MDKRVTGFKIIKLSDIFIVVILSIKLEKGETELLLYTNLQRLNFIIILL